jgi:pimeloyl-ACP methyl ester carboxylesterase
MRRETRVVHGHTRAYLVAGLPVGTAPVLWLIHGIGDSSATWQDVIPLLEDRYTIIAPDLLGHGHSDKPRADYSVAGFANGMRDLMVLLGVERATIVGHSLGGGVACQFAYQYPERVERLVLVAAGGLGAEVNPVLRLLALPGAAAAIGASCNPLFRRPVLTASRVLAAGGLLDPSDVDEVATIWQGLRDRSTRSAFLRTLRTSVDVRGQALTSRDRLYLTENIPTLVIWGKRDPVLPVRHARAAAEALPGATVRVVNRAGHMPHRSNPRAFSAVLADFVAGTTPSVHDHERWAALMAGEEATVLSSVAV